MNGPNFPRRMFLAFAILSAADFAMTWQLLSRGASFYEANPVANWWLGKFGWMGLAGFKASAVLVAAGLAALVGVRRPRAARNLLAFGCLAVGSVVIYSGVLARTGHATGEASDSAEVAQIRDANAEFDGRLSRVVEYRTVLNRVSGEVVASRMSLADATDQLAETEHARDAAWRHCLAHKFPELEIHDKLAAIIVQNALHQPHLFPGAAREVDRLRTDLRNMCGVDMPLEFDAPPSIADADPRIALAAFGFAP